MHLLIVSPPTKQDKFPSKYNSNNLKTKNKVKVKELPVQLNPSPVNPALQSQV